MFKMGESHIQIPDAIIQVYKTFNGDDWLLYVDKIYF